MAHDDGHPGASLLDTDEPDDVVSAHLAVCAKCRIDHRILRRSRQEANGVAAPPPPPPGPEVEWSEASSIADPVVTPPLVAGESVGRFEVIRLVGRGAMGEVYLARDTQLGRKVALKLVRNGVLARPDLRERFLREAQLTARFSHPNIVTTYDVGEHQGRPWLALEFLDGESLRDRLAAAAIAPRQAARVGLAVARALEEAHVRGVVHRDLKPENIVLPTDGRVRVVDFGLARPIAVDPHADAAFRSRQGQLVGTPAYMAPEQWAAQSAAPAADVWALGVVLHEMLAGVRPFPSTEIPRLMAEIVDRAPVPRLPSVPEELAELVARCLEKDPTRRPAAAEVADGLERHLHGRHPEASEDELSPFRGLLPFDERHGALFVGRDAEVDGLVERLRDEAVLPVVGPSGAGKSSLVAAGLLPRLREQGRWVFFRVRPGAHPFETLVARIERGPTRSTSSSGGPPEADAPYGPDLAARLARSPELLAWLLQKVGVRHDARVLLFVDQLEELYTHVEDPAVRHAFARAICAAADDPEGPVRVVFTVRDDFLVRLAETPEAHQVLSRLAVVRSPAPRELRQILVEPVQRAGYRYEDDRLVEEMIAAVEQEVACLPLLQFAGAQLWERRDRERKVLTREAYLAMGGVEGSLARHADAVVDAMAPTQARLARTLLLRLVTAEGTRRVTTRRRVLGGLPAEGEAVLATLVDGRAVLVGRVRGDDDGEAQVELVHESLIQRWARLAGWLAEERSEVAFLREAEQAAALWVARGRHDAEVWSGEALWDARRTSARLDSLPPEVAAFLEAGARVEAAARGRRRAALGLGVGLLAVVALGAVGAAVRINREKEQGDTHRAAALLASAFGERAAGHTLEAGALLREALELRDEAGARALWWRLLEAPLWWQTTLPGNLESVAVGPDQRTIAVGSGRTLYLVDARTGHRRALRGQTVGVDLIKWSTSGRRIATADPHGALYLWNVDDGSAIEMAVPSEVDTTELSWRPDDAVVAAAGLDGVLRLFDVRTATLKGQFDVPGGQISGAEYSPNGRSFATTADDGVLRMWDPEAGTERFRVVAHPAGPTVLAWTRDGAGIVTAGSDGTLKVWDAATGAAVRGVAGHVGRVQALAIDSDGTIASSGTDGSTRLWSGVDGSLSAVLQMDTSPVYDVSFGAGFVASVNHDGALRVWRTGGAPVAGSPAGETGGHDRAVLGVAFSPDGQRVATSSDDGTARVWDRASGRTLRTIKVDVGSVAGIAFLPNGRELITSSQDGTLRVWDLATGARLQALVGPPVRAGYLAITDDGLRVAASSKLGDVRVWEVGAEAPPQVLASQGRILQHIDFSADGARLVAGGFSGVTRAWDRAGKLLGTLEQRDGVRGLRIHPDGQSVYVSGDGMNLWRWDLTTFQARKVATLEVPGTGLDVFPAGDRLAVGGEDGRVHIVDLATGTSVAWGGHPVATIAVEVSPDGDAVASTSYDWSVRLWDGVTGMPLWRGPLLRKESGELYTHEGWRSPATGATLEPATAGWRTAIETHARLAAEADGLLCVATFDGGLETWDIAEDRVRSRAALPDIQDLRAVPGACVVLAGGEASLHTRDGRTVPLHADITALAASRDEILVAADAEVLAYGPDGQERGRWPAGHQILGVGRVGDRIGVGYEDGTIELLSAVGAPTVTFNTGVMLPMLRIVSGPEGTFAAGFYGGEVGLWSVETGERLQSGRLHGAVQHLEVVGRSLVAATDLGQWLAWDLSVFDEDYCALLREVWAGVPITMRSGRPELADPPAGHRCRAE